LHESSLWVIIFVTILRKFKAKGKVNQLKIEKGPAFAKATARQAIDNYVSSEL
jgi:hypothetical protein